MEDRDRRAGRETARPVRLLDKLETTYRGLRIPLPKVGARVEAARNAGAPSDSGAGRTQRPAGLSLSLSAERITRVLLLVAAALVVLSLAIGFVWLLGGPFVRLFYVGADLSLPSWYSALILALASTLLATIACSVRAGESPRYARRWTILAVIFAYLSCDEMLRLHERMTDTALRPALEFMDFAPAGFLYYPWVLVYAPLVAIFALAYLGFWRALPPGTRRLFLVAGVIFVGGAMGVELFNAWYDSKPGGDVVILFGTHVEEALEMIGIIAFVYALISYLASRMGPEQELRLDLTPRL